MISIRIMGDKEKAEEIAKRIAEIFKTNFKSYAMYKDKKNRTEIDNTKIRLYANL